MNRPDIRVSIVVPIYNVEAYLPRCVDSLLGQDMPDIEILLVDDGSPDGCGTLCDAYAARDARVQAFHKPNGGLSDARNYGLDRARGTYVLFVDSDDYLEPDACSSLLADAAAAPDMVIGKTLPEFSSAAMERFERIAANRFACHVPYTGRDYLTGCLEGGALRVEVWRTLYRRAFLVENDLRFCKGIAHEDEEFTPRALLAAQTVVLTDHAFYHYDNTRMGSIMNDPSMQMKKLTDRVHLYNALRAQFRTVMPRRLRRLLEDDLAWKYLDCYTACPPEFRQELGIRRSTVLQCAYHSKRRLKALAFAVSPALYAALTRR